MAIKEHNNAEFLKPILWSSNSLGLIFIDKYSVPLWVCNIAINLVVVYFSVNYIQTKIAANFDNCFKKNFCSDVVESVNRIIQPTGELRNRRNRSINDYQVNKQNRSIGNRLNNQQLPIEPKFEYQWTPISPFPKTYSDSSGHRKGLSNNTVTIPPRVISRYSSYSSMSLFITIYIITKHFRNSPPRPLQLSGSQTPDHSQNPILSGTQQTAHLLGAQILRSHLYIHLRSHHQLQPRGYATGSTATSLYQFQWLSSDRYSHFDAVPCHTKVV